MSQGSERRVRKNRQRPCSVFSVPRETTRRWSVSGPSPTRRASSFFRAAAVATLHQAPTVSSASSVRTSSGREAIVSFTGASP